MAKRSAQTSGGASPAEASYTTRPLDASTWDAFAELVERNNGVYGGCWCIAHHVEYQRGVSDPRTLKEELVRAGRAHAALVFDEDDLAQGWCQYGSPEELGLKHQREYAKDPPPPARWRIACIFVDKRHRGRGVARAGLGGRARPDRRRRRRARRGDFRGDRRTGGSRPVPVQRDRRAVRATGVHEGTAGRQARVDPEPRDRPRLGPPPSATRIPCERAVSGWPVFGVTPERALTPLADLLGQPDEDPLGASDVAEPIDVFVLDHFVDELRAVSAGAGRASRRGRPRRT